jgi:hypothetical protein
MREESQLDEMRAAIRGDFERLAERRGDQELMRIAAEEHSARPAVDATETEEKPSRSWGARLGRWFTHPEA